MKKNRSYTYELADPAIVISKARQELKTQDAPWPEIGDNLVGAHIEYRPIRNNPMRSGYQFQYRQAGLDLTVYLPESQFNYLVDVLNRERVQMLKSLFQAVIPERSGYILREFKIRGILDEPGPGES